MHLFVGFFLPHHANNHRAKILHHQSLLAIFGIICIFQIFLFVLKQSQPNILGLTTDISVENLLYETNQERQKNGVTKLSLDLDLSRAASQKAQDMFLRNYWAHNGPDGTTPWVFIKAAGYEYSFAGENLARDFSKSQDVVKAWMTSPKHKDNILSNNFEDIGLAVVEGKLNGKETTLVVQMFGKRSQTALLRKPQSVSPNVQGSSSIEQKIAYSGGKFEPLFDVNKTSRTFSIVVLGLLIGVLLIDMIIIERKRIVRLVGHNFDHILFLAGPLLLSILHIRGSIL